MKQWLINQHLAWVGLKVLVRELGLFHAVLWGGKSKSRPDPFATLAPPTDNDEVLSRGQMGPAVQLYQELLEHLGESEALRITGAVVYEGAQTFLGHIIGPIDVLRYDAMNDQRRQQYVDGIAQKFFNATGEVTEISRTGFTYTVQSCTFVRLAHAINIPHLAPLFCSGDIAFFDQGPVELTRQSTLAQGGTCCPFKFALKADVD